MPRPVVALTAYGEAFCTGTLVSSRTVLTAGHCVEDSGYTASDVSVFFGNVVGGTGTSIPASACRWTRLSSSLNKGGVILL